MTAPFIAFPPARNASMALRLRMPVHSKPIALTTGAAS
jgi:hypothetical protein